MGFSLGQGIAQIKADMPMQNLPVLGGNFSGDLTNQNNYKMLGEWLTIENNFTIELPTNATSDTTINFSYADGSFFKQLKNFQWKLNANETIKNIPDLEYYKILYHLNNNGLRPYNNAPKSVTIPQGQKSANINIQFVVPMPLISEQNINFLSTFICAWLYQNNTIQGDCVSVNDIVSVNNPNATITPNSLKIKTTGEFWIVDNDYLYASTTEAVLEKIGYLPRTTSKLQPFTASGADQIIDLNPTDLENLNRLVLIVRDAETKQRIDTSVIERIRVTDGFRDLIDTDPVILNQFTANRYDLDFKKSFSAVDDDELDGIGALYGVLTIDTSFFGDMKNAVLATGNWAKPKIYLNIGDLSNYTKGIEICVLTDSIVQIQALQSMINNYVRVATDPTKM